MSFPLLSFTFMSLSCSHLLMRNFSGSWQIILLSILGFSRAIPFPESQVDHEIELEDLEDLLAVENQLDKAIVAIQPAPKGFPGERLVSRPIAPAPKDFPGERLTEEGATDPAAGSYSFR